MKNKQYQKKTGYSPPQRIEPSPVKPWSNKLKINSYYADGRGCGPTDGRMTASSNYTTIDIVKLRDCE